MFLLLLMSRPARGGWIEILGTSQRFSRIASRPARGGWIEMRIGLAILLKRWVPPRTGRVD
mgnify:CR=1 FL=1